MGKKKCLARDPKYFNKYFIGNTKYKYNFISSERSCNKTSKVVHDHQKSSLAPT